MLQCFVCLSTGVLWHDMLIAVDSLGVTSLNSTTGENSLLKAEGSLTSQSIRYWDLYFKEKNISSSEA